MLHFMRILIFLGTLIKSLLIKKKLMFLGIIDLPGFPNGSNFLHPWDTKIKVNSRREWMAIANSFSKKHKSNKLDFGKQEKSDCILIRVTNALFPNTFKLFLIFIFIFFEGLYF